METFTDDVMRKLLRSSLKTVGADASGSRCGRRGRLRRRRAHQSQSAHHRQPGAERGRERARIRHHPLVPGDIPIYGYIHDGKSSNLIKVPKATAAGQTR
jgi:carbonic anhydrase